MPQRWFIRNASTDLLTGRHPHSGGCKNSAGHVTEMSGHVPEFGGHATEMAGHDDPKFAGRPPKSNECAVHGTNPTGWKSRYQVSAEPKVSQLKTKIRELTRRTRGRRLTEIVQELT